MVRRGGFSARRASLAPWVLPGRAADAGGSPDRPPRSPHPLVAAIGLFLLLGALLGGPGCASAAAEVASAANTPVVTTLLRAATGAWIAVGYSSEGVWAWQAAGLDQPDLLTACIPLVRAVQPPGIPAAVAAAEGGVPVPAFCPPASGTAPLTAEGVVDAATAFLDASDRLHLAWRAGGKSFYARCPLGQLGEPGAWQGPTGGAAPEPVAPGLSPTTTVAGAGGRPVLAGARGDGIAVVRFDGEWQETLGSFKGVAPLLARDAARALHLVFASADGVHHCRGGEGDRWQARELPLPGRVSGRPALAVRDVTPLVAAMVDDRLAVAVRHDSGWARVPLPPAMAEGQAPALVPDRHGTVWCLWRAAGWLRAARWLGDGFGPAFPLGPVTGPFLPEAPPPASAPDLGVRVPTESGLQVLRLSLPGLVVAEGRAVRFLDLLEVAHLEGAVREGIVPLAQGSLPSPAGGECLPGGILPLGRNGRLLRAWFSIREGDRWVGCTAEWSGRKWRVPEPLRLAAPRPWIQPPAGALSVVADPDDPVPERRLKMLAARAGPAPALLTSGDGLTWAYYSEVPPLRPLALLRDPLGGIEQRWKAYGSDEESARLSLLVSPDREHWYPAAVAGDGLTCREATFWVEDGLVLGLLDGGRLVAGRDGVHLVPVGELPALVDNEGGQLFAPPLVWQGQRRLFLARPEAWRWLQLPPTGRWIGLRAARDDVPARCETIPILRVGPAAPRLLLDARAGGTAAIGVEVLDAAERPVLTGRVRRGDGWLEVQWERGQALSRLETPSLRLRFSIEPGAVLYGFRFSE